MIRMLNHIAFDYLYEEQEIYSFYDEIFEQKKYGIKNKNIFSNKKIYFYNFIENYQKYFLDIYNDTKKINRLKKLRWYILFDEDNYIENFYSIIYNENQNNNTNDSFTEKEQENFYNKFISNDKTLSINNNIKEIEENILNEIIIDKLLSKENNPLFYDEKLELNGIVGAYLFFNDEDTKYLFSNFDSFFDEERVEVR